MKQFVDSLQNFFKLEQSTGILLMLCIVAAFFFANTGLHDIYHTIMHSKFTLELVGLSIVGKDFHYFVNDGLMAIFFFLIGLEVKREFLKGELSDPKNILLPAACALGGLLVPIAIYKFFNAGTVYEAGWAIPAATDIAIAFGVLALLGSRIPTSLKVFLMMIAIFDDVMVVGIIAIFFSEPLKMQFVYMAFACCAALFALNRFNVKNFAPFAIIGFFLWYAILKSGIHATIAGIVLAMFIPMKDRFVYDTLNNVKLKRKSMLESIEHTLHEFVSFIVLPIFVFVNAGIALSAQDFTELSGNMPMGIILGLLIGKQVGIFGTALLLIKTKIVELPKGANMGQIYGVALLCGIGFTMGLFIGDLSFKDIEANFKLPIIVGSIISGILGLIVLNLSSKKVVNEQPAK